MVTNGILGLHLILLLKEDILLHMFKIKTGEPTTPLYTLIFKYYNYERDFVIIIYELRLFY